MPEEHLIDPADYSSPTALAAEQQRIFRRAWHLASLARDTPSENDYIRRKIGLTDLVIHRHGGRIVAYANVCPHRFAAFFDDERGNAPIRCSYHLWTFNNEGVAVGVPHRHGEALACYQTPALRLDMWRVELVGEFVFVSAEPAAELADFLGPMLPTLRQLSDVVGDERTSITQPIAANWKIVLQNTVEADHVQSIHAETFAAIMQKPLHIEGDPECENSISYLIRMDSSRHANKRDARVDSIFRRVNLPYPDGYRQHLIFPSTLIGYIDNRQLAIMDYQPGVPDSCTLTARMFDFKVPDLSESERAMLEIVRPRDLGFTERLFAEDQKICEAVQRGLSARPQRMNGALLPGEKYTRRFQEIYSYWMK
jgi:choline monooxygenase